MSNHDVKVIDSWDRIDFCISLKADFLLAHLSRRFIGEHMVYKWSGVRPSVRKHFQT